LRKAVVFGVVQVGPDLDRCGCIGHPVAQPAEIAGPVKRHSCLPFACIYSSGRLGVEPRSARAASKAPPVPACSARYESGIPPSFIAQRGSSPVFWSANTVSRWL